MIAVLDIGNSSIKYALCEIINLHNPPDLINYKPKKTLTFTSVSETIQQLYYDSTNITDIVYSTVNTKLADELLRHTISINSAQFIGIEETVPFLFSLNYSPKSSYGQDRLAFCYYCTFCYPEDIILAIDFGTAITYEYIYDHSYKGGAIFPGTQILLNALHKNTSKLPQLQFSCKTGEMFGFTTKSSILSASFHYPIATTKYYIDYLIDKSNISQLHVVITGGYGDYIYSYFINNPTRKTKFSYDKYAVIKGLMIFYSQRKLNKGNHETLV